LGDFDEYRKNNYAGKRLAAALLIAAATYYLGGDALQGFYDGLLVTSSTPSQTIDF